MKPSTFLTLALTLLLVASYANIWRSFDPRGNDFSAFYAGALLWKQSQPIFDQSKVCEIQSTLGGRLCMPFFHPPILLPMVSLVSTNNFLESYQRWTIVLLAILILCVIAIYQLSGSALHTLALITFLPMLFGFLHGQDSIFVLLGLLLFALFLRNGKDVLAGLALSLTVLRPTLAIALGIPLVFTNRRAFYAFFSGGLVLTLYSFALVGIEGFSDLAHGLLTVAQADPTTRPDRMYSVVGALYWLGLDTHWAWLLFALSIPTILFLWRKKGLSALTLALAIIVTTFTSPHLHIHDLIFLIVPLIAWPGLIIILVSGTLMVASLFGITQVFTYILMAFSSVVLLSRVHFDSSRTLAWSSFTAANSTPTKPL